MHADGMTIRIKKSAQIAAVDMCPVTDTHPWNTMHRGAIQSPSHRGDLAKLRPSTASTDCWCPLNSFAVVFRSSDLSHRPNPFPANQRTVVGRSSVSASSLTYFAIFVVKMQLSHSKQDKLLNILEIVFKNYLLLLLICQSARRCPRALCDLGRLIITLVHAPPLQRTLPKTRETKTSHSLVKAHHRS